MNLDWLPYLIFIIINNIVWYIIIKYAIKSLIPPHILRLSKQAATMMRKGRTAKATSKEVIKLRESGKKKISEALPKMIPGAEILKAIGLTDNEVFSLVSDTEFMTSIMKILNVVQSMGQGLSGLLGKRKKKDGSPYYQ